MGLRSEQLQAAFLTLKDHAWFKKIYKRLKSSDLLICSSFIKARGDLEVEEFDRAVVRMFLDNPNKPRRWKEIQELLVNANSLINKRGEK